MYAHMGKVLQDNYPEIVKRTYIVNGMSLLQSSLYKVELIKALTPSTTKCSEYYRQVNGSEYLGIVQKNQNYSELFLSLRILGNSSE